MQAGIGFSAQADYSLAVKEAIAGARSVINREKIDLAFLFSTTTLNHPLTLKNINEALNNIPLLGLSTPAIMVNRGIFKNGLAVLLISLPEETYFNTACVKEINTSGAREAGGKLGEKLLYGCKGVRRDLSIIFSDGQIPDAHNITLGLQEKVGKSFPLIGASTCNSIAAEEKTCLYFGNSALNNAACGILFGGKLNFGLGIKHGWQPLGKPHLVTKSSDNIVEEIDGKKAADLYREYFSKTLLGIKSDLRRLAVFYPLGINIPGEKEYLLRNLSAIDDAGALVFNGDVLEGSTVRLMISSKKSCLEATQLAAESAKKILTGKKIKFVLVFNSSARYTLMSRQESAELEAIKEVFGNDTPLAGIYTASEQAPLSSVNYLGRPYFHNNSIAILAIAN